MSFAITIPIVIYILATFYIGLRAHKVMELHAEDYFLAGRNVSWWHLGLTMFATWFSTFAFLGVPGFFYAKGIKWFVTIVGFNIGAIFLVWFVGRKVWLIGKSRGHITPADMLVDYYKSKYLRTVVAIICILALIPYCLIQFVGVGKVIEASSAGEIPYSLGVLVVAGATLFYSVLGGVRAIIWTDALQGIVFLAVILIGCCVAYHFSGGIFAGFEKSLAIKPEAFKISAEEAPGIITFIFTWSFGFLTLPHMWQRSYMGKSAADFSKGLVIFMILTLTFLLSTMLTGILGISLVSNISDSDKFIPMMFENYAPWALPIIVLATFAAGMSTIDSQLLSASSVLVRDIAKPFFKNGENKRLEDRLGKIFVALLIAGLAFLSLLPEAQGSIIMLANKGTMISVLLLAPLLCSLYNLNISGRTCLTALISSAVLLAFFEFDILPTSLLPFGLGAIIYAVGLQAIIMITAHLRTRAR